MRKRSGFDRKSKVAFAQGVTLFLVLVRCDPTCPKAAKVSTCGLPTILPEPRFATLLARCTERKLVGTVVSGDDKTRFGP